MSSTLHEMICKIPTGFVESATDLPDFAPLQSVTSEATTRECVRHTSPHASIGFRKKPFGLEYSSESYYAKDCVEI